MRELCAEGLATSGDPESCVHSREAVGEALTGAGAGRVLSREKKQFRVPTLLAMGAGIEVLQIAACTPRMNAVCEGRGTVRHRRAW
jgi:hypothetical protein